MENTPSNVLSITLKRLNQKRNSMAKKPPKTDLRENPKPSGKVRKEYVPPASCMVIKRDIFGEDLGKKKK